MEKTTITCRNSQAEHPVYKTRWIILFSFEEIASWEQAQKGWLSTEQASPISNVCENKHKNTGPILHLPEGPAFYLEDLLSQSCDIPAVCA